MAILIKKRLSDYRKCDVCDVMLSLTPYSPRFSNSCFFLVSHSSVLSVVWDEAGVPGAGLVLRT